MTGRESCELQPMFFFDASLTGKRCLMSQDHEVYEAVKGPVSGRATTHPSRVGALRPEFDARFVYRKPD